MTCKFPGPFYKQYRVHRSGFIIQSREHDPHGNPRLSFLTQHVLSLSAVLDTTACILMTFELHCKDST